MNQSRSEGGRGRIYLRRTFGTVLGLLLLAAEAYLLSRPSEAPVWSLLIGSVCGLLSTVALWWSAARMRPRMGVAGFAWLQGVISVVALVAAALPFTMPYGHVALTNPYVFVPVIGYSSIVHLASLPSFYRSRAQQRGAPGKLRLGTAGILASIVASLTFVGGRIVYEGHAASVGAGFSFRGDLQEALLSLPSAYQPALRISAVSLAVVALFSFASLIALWKLLPRRWRTRTWLALDLAIAGAFAWLTSGRLDALHLAEQQTKLIRIGLVAVFVIRLTARGIPATLRLIEKTSFEGLVAGRYLLSKKSGFLAAIGTLAIGAVAVSTAMLVAVLSVMGGFRDDLKSKILGSQAHIVISNEEGRFEGWADALARVEATSGVKAASPFLSGEIMVSSATSREGVLLRGVTASGVANTTELRRAMTNGTLESLDHPDAIRSSSASGRTVLPLDFDFDVDDRGLDDVLPERAPEPAADVVTLPAIVIGKTLARSLRVFVGDELDLISPLGELGPNGPMPKTRRFRIGGIFYTGMYEFDMKLVYIELAEAQSFLGSGDAINGIEVRADHIEDAPTVAAAIRTNLEPVPGHEHFSVADWQELNRGLFGALELEKLGMFLTLGLAVLIAGFCVFGTLTLLVQEKRRAIGIFLSMGATRKTIVRMFMLEGLLIGVQGASIGLGLGYLITYSFEHFGIELNPEVHYIDRLPVSMDPREFAAVALASLLVCVVSTVFPAFLASRLSPVEALRS